jgi:hypothetical protein
MAKATTPKTPFSSRPLLVALRFLLGVCAAAYVVYVARSDLPRVLPYVSPFSVARAGWLALCSLLLECGILVNVVFRILARRYSGVALEYHACLQLVLVTNLLRYLPGRVFGIAYQVSKPLPGLSGAGMLRVNVEQLATSIVGSSIAASGVLYLERGEAARGVGLIALALPAMVLALQVRVPSGLLRGLEARGPRSLRKFLQFPAAGRLNAPALWSVATLTLLGWLPYLLAWHWLARAFPLLEGQPLLALAASYVLAWVAGIVAFVTPGGVGVREAVFVLLSPPGVAREAVALLAVFMRVWFLVADVAACAVGTALLRLFTVHARPSKIEP